MENQLVIKEKQEIEKVVGREVVITKASDGCNLLFDASVYGIRVASIYKSFDENFNPIKTIGYSSAAFDIYDFIRSLEEVRKDHINSKIPRIAGDRFAVIVDTNTYLGVQYWTQQMIDAGSSTNSDKSVSVFVCKL